MVSEMHKKCQDLYLLVILRILQLRVSYSYAVDFEQYLDAEVTVIGQYSGDTLFVGQIQ